jgi:hypothetical protein
MNIQMIPFTEQRTSQKSSVAPRSLGSAQLFRAGARVPVGRAIFSLSGSLSGTALGLITGIVPLPAAAQPRDSGQLVGVHSGACLGRTGGPAAVDCRRAPMISLIRLQGGQGRLMVRDESQNACLFSNRDGRFGWYACTPEYEDQHWTFTGAPPAGPVAAEAMQGRMLRAVHSGQCLFSNRDGRFGLYNCVPAYGDQFWRLADAGRGRGWERQERTWDQPLPPPGPPPPPLMPVERRPPRDCGTGDDPGCQERRDGAFAMTQDVWAGFFANLKATRNELTRRDLVLMMAQSSYLTARQLVQVLELFRNELVQLEVVRGVVAHVIDPQRALEYGARIRNSINRQEYVQILMSARPAGPPPRR